MGALVQAGDLVAGKYRLEREIGSGGMGVVYAAVHVHLEQRVALKFVNADAANNAEVIQRFWREARAAVKIQSEHVARVIDIGQLDGGTPYIVMEYLEGDDLDNVVRGRGPLEIRDAVRYVLQACEALAEVHVQGIVHRDIKPANLFLADRPDGSRLVKLLDFGISKPAFYEQTDGSLTQTAAVIGSPRYMSPEQLRSSRDVDVRSDLWAIGVTLFELLGGTSPFARGTMPEVCASILKDPPLSLTQLRPELPSALEAVIAKCLAKDPNERWKDVGELAVALRPFGPLGIIDISIERIVGVIQQAETTKRPTRPPPTGESQRLGASADGSSSSSSSSSSGPASPRPGSFADGSSGLPPLPPATPRAKTPTGDRTTPIGTPGLSLAELEGTLVEQLGGKRRVPTLAIDPHHLTLLALDPRSGFLLSLVDSSCTVEEILDISGLPRVDALRILCELRERGVIRIKA
ncbi:MAG: serine/threonine protein kinase [Deltaproteobacteria bacterium]|nr:serine/threonine protein kinase [Deltaproteobacteria bacterium]